MQMTRVVVVRYHCALCDYWADFALDWDERETKERGEDAMLTCPKCSGNRAYKAGRPE